MNNINRASASDQHLLCLQTRWLIIIKCFQFYRVLQVGSCQPQSTRLRDFLSTNIQRFSSPLPLARLRTPRNRFLIVGSARIITHRDISQLGLYCTLIHRYTWWQIYHITMPLYYRIIYPFQMYYKIIYPSQIYYTLHNNIFLPDVSKISVSLRAILRADISLPIYLKLM